MLKIYIQGLKDGIYDVDISSPVNQIPEMFDEFFGNVDFKGKLRIIGKRYAVTGTAVCKAKMICDLTLSEFVEEISAEFKASYHAVEHLSAHIVESEKDSLNEHFIKDDDKHLNISDEVAEELAVNLPMKRVAPEFRGKSFEEIYPEYTQPKAEKKKKKLNDEEVDDRWAPLKSLKYKKN